MSKESGHAQAHDMSGTRMVVADSRIDGPSTPAARAILEATLELLDERGYVRVTTDLIATRAQISKATLYRFWPSKQELVVAAVQLRFPPMKVPELEDFEAEVRYLLTRRMDAYRQPGTLRLVAGLVGASMQDPRLLEVFEHWVEQLNAIVRSIIQRGIARADVRPDVDFYAVETLITGVVARSVIIQGAFPDTLTAEIAHVIAESVRPR